MSYAPTDPEAEDSVKRVRVQEQASSMKMPMADYKPMRDGMRNMKAEAAPAHPVEEMQRQVRRQATTWRLTCPCH